MQGPRSTSPHRPLTSASDWTSTYLALQNDVDPGPIDAIFDLKSRLAQTP